MEIINFILDSQYTYLLVFFGIMLGGEVILVPAVYLALIGGIDTAALFGLTIGATIIADSTWYVVGMVVPNKRLGRLSIVKKRKAFIDRFSEFFDQYALKLLFYSKFVYGTRLITQLLFGIYRKNFIVYSVVNLAGVLSWTIFIFAVGVFVNYSLDSLKDMVFGAQLVFAVFVGSIVLIHLIIRRLAKRTWRLNGSTRNGSETQPDRVKESEGSYEQ